MAKLYFRYGCMDSSKTLRLLADAHEYEERGENPLLIKPVLDTRSETGFIESRAGLKAPCTEIGNGDNLTKFVDGLVKMGVADCIFVDEAQFLTVDQVVQLRIIADGFNIPVMCYGLKTDFQGHLFDGSKALFENANRVEEIKTICREKGCKHKAMYNGRFDKDGSPIFEGETVKIGDTKERADESSHYYVPKCSVHFFEDVKKFYTAKGIM